MTDDTQRHFDAVRRVARHQAEAEWLKERYAMLARQQAVLSALASAREALWDSNEKELTELAKLQTHAGRCAIATCESIMRHSGLVDLDKSEWGDTPTTESGDAREESLPW